jgi:hypothetical protein
MKLFYDLHMHSCLSPCGDQDMTPNNIVNMCLLKELDVIALSDHNTAKNIPAVRKLTETSDLLLIPAIEVCTSEEIHVLCLFYDFDSCYRFSDDLYELLPPISNKPDIFGEQLILDEHDNVVGSLDKLLINAANLSIDQLIATLPSYHGFAVPAHVDKNSYSIISNLGFIPEEYHFPCIEVKNPPFSYPFSGTVITNSDAHYLENISEREHCLEVPEKSIQSFLNTLSSSRPQIP